MTREDAEHWAKDSKIQDVLTHTTARGNLTFARDDDLSDLVRVDGVWVPRSSAAMTASGAWVMKDPDELKGGILRDGFKVGFSGVFGNGIYLGAEELEIGRAGEDGSTWGGAEPAPHDMMIEDRQAREYGYGSDRESAPTLRVKVDVRKPFVVNIPHVYGDAEELINLELQRRHPKAYELAQTTHGVVINAKVFPDLGYDALVIRHEGRFDWDIGGDQVIVWDPKKVTVLVDEAGKPEDYRYRKYAPNQPRDDQGQWTSTGASASPSPSSYKIGRVLDGNADLGGDFRVESTPSRRFTELWQASYAGYGLVRQAAANVIDGNDPLDGIDFNRERRGEIPLMLATWTQAGSGYTLRDIKTDVASAGRFVAEGLRNGTSGTPLWRGTELESADSLKVGDAVALGPTSASDHRGTAEAYAGSSPGKGVRTMFYFDASTKRFNLDNNTHPESIVMGDFEVQHVNHDEHGTHVFLKPTDQP